VTTIDDVLSGRAKWCRKDNWTGECAQCRTVFSRYVRPSLPRPMYCCARCRNKHIASRPDVKGAKAAARRGEKSIWWKGDAIAERSGRTRALRAFPEKAPCEACGAERSERHHKDGNTKNNAAENVARLCRRCHMTEDGRLGRVRAMMKELQPKGVEARWNKN
jgi:hypothetical protein